MKPQIPLNLNVLFIKEKLTKNTFIPVMIVSLVIKIRSSNSDDLE